MSSTCGSIAFSSPGSYATGVSVAPTRTTGASRDQKQCSAAHAATSAPNPAVRVSSWTTRSRLVRLGGLRDQIVVPRRKRSEVHDLHVDPLGSERLGRQERLLHGRSPCDDREVAARPRDRSATERDLAFLWAAWGRRRISACRGACAPRRAPGPRSRKRSGADRRHRPPGTGRRRAVPGCDRRSTRRIGSARSPRRSGSHRSRRVRRAGSRMCRSSATCGGGLAT